MISRREFLRRAAVITGGTAAGLVVLGRMAHAQSRPKMRVWLFKSFVTDCNDILAKHIEAWAKERQVEVEFDWATFGDREQKFVAAIEAGNPPARGRDELPGADAHRPALRDVTKLAKEIASARAHLRTPTGRAVQRPVLRRGHQAFGGGTAHRKGSNGEKGLTMPKLYDPT